MWILGQWDEPARPAVSSSKQAASKQQQAPKRGEKLKHPFWGTAAPWTGPGSPSKHLRGPGAPRCAHFPPAGCVRLPIWPKNGPKRGPRAPGWVLVGSGGRVLGQNPLGQRVGCLFLLFCPFLSCQQCHLATNGPKRGPVARGHAPPGSGGRILGWNPLGQHAGCLLVMICRLFSPNRPKMGPKRPRLSFSKKDPRPTGVLNDTVRAVLTRLGPF